MSEAICTFTPAAQGRIILLVDFEAYITAGTFSDWSASGNYAIARGFIRQGGSTTYGPTQRMTTTRAKYLCQHFQNVVANSEVQCGLDLNGGGLISAVAYYVNIRAHLVKETSS